MPLAPERGARLTPMIGQTGSSNDSAAAQHIASLQDRLSNIERNWNIPDDAVIRAMLVDVLKPPIGEIRWVAGPTVPAGHLLADGSAVSRTAYSLLFAAIGTTWGAGDGSTTFALPNAVNRLPFGAGGGVPLGTYGGSFTANLAHDHTGAPHTHPQMHHHGVGTIAIAHDHDGGPHTHSHSHTSAAHSHGHTHTSAAHSHSHSHTSAAHTHSHSHTSAAHSHSHSHTSAAHSHSHSHTGAAHSHPGSHSHGIPHNHLTDIDHDHPSFTSGPENEAPNTINNGTLIAVTTVPSPGHHHPVNVPALGSSPVASGGASGGATSDADSNAPAASYTGNSGTDATSTTPGDTGSDATSTTPGNSGTDATSTTPGSTGSDATSTTPGATGSDATSTTPGDTGADATSAGYTGRTGAAVDVSSSGTTADDSTANGATFTAQTGTALSTTTSILPPYLALLPCIYA
jgi:hypothetical protein